MKHYFFTFIFAILLLVSAVGNAHAQDCPDKLAQNAVESWVSLWDAGKYDQSYGLLAQLTRDEIDKRNWFVYWSAVRKPLGALKSRKLKEITLIKSLPGAPDQEGATLQFESSFESRNSVLESFGMVKEKDGTWRVANYLTN